LSQQRLLYTVRHSTARLLFRLLGAELGAAGLPPLGNGDATALDLTESRASDASGPSSLVLSEARQTPKRFQIVHNSLRDDIVVMQVYECQWPCRQSKTRAHR